MHSLYYSEASHVTCIWNLPLMFSDCNWRNNSFPTVFWFFAALHLLWGCWHASWGLVVPLLCPILLWFYKQQTSGKLQNITKLIILDLLLVLILVYSQLWLLWKAFLLSVLLFYSLNFTSIRFCMLYHYLLSTVDYMQINMYFRHFASRIWRWMLPSRM